jgi:hypothetical protein
MGWSESEKVDEWILRAYENGRREERERIIKLLEENDHYSVDWLIELINGQPTECECDPCGDENCTCQGKRCKFCQAKED